MKRFHIILSSCLLVLLTACEKEIDLDYHQVDAYYVAEASLTQDGTEVRLSTTQDMTDNNRNAHTIAGATIVLSSEGEVLDTLLYAGNGKYKSGIKGIPGITYDLDIYVHDRHFASSSTMQQAPVVKEFRFVWKKMLSERMLFGDLRLLVLLCIDQPFGKAVAGVDKHCRNGNEHNIAVCLQIQRRIQYKGDEPGVPLFIVS